MQTYLKALLESLVSGLSAEPRVAANVCWAFTSLAERAYEMAEEQATANGTADDSDTPQTYCLSQVRMTSALPRMIMNSLLGGWRILFEFSIPLYSNY